MANVFDKDPDAVLDYEWNWTNWLVPGDSIETVALVADFGITINSFAVDAGKVIAWLSGGTAGQVYKINCRIITNIGRTDDRTMMIICRPR